MGYISLHDLQRVTASTNEVWYWPAVWAEKIQDRSKGEHCEAHVRAGTGRGIFWGSVTVRDTVTVCIYTGWW